MASIQLYAELLLNIRTVTFFATLKSEHNHETKATLSADGESITVTHEGESASIRLPTKISGGGSAALALPPTPAKELTLRLLLEEKAPGLLRYSDFPDSGSDNPVPWDALSLSTETEIKCGKCDNVLIPKGTVREWKDLPSENWADMMDFWHCHKPDEHHDHSHHDANDAPSRKGYAAGNKLTASSGTGFVDTMYFLLAAEDCAGAVTNKTLSEPAATFDVLCNQCNMPIGVVDDIAGGYRIFKWAVIVAHEDESEQNDIQQWISAQLLAAIQNIGVRKFAIQQQGSGKERPGGLMLWVFTPDLCFSSSVHHESRHDPTRAMKVFWQHQLDLSRVIERQSTSFEHIELPTAAYASLEDALQSNADLLPSSAQRFQDWNVSLLQRFEGSTVREPRNPIDALYE
ncbi:hypothetical protein NA57DRAFT_58364 [Rhizodiscina lignyota]|uniref:Ubiquitin-conjugating enzyme E2-binding protein n=1 Tax=Rhizodiscina lignyota TaxID=1504668 RepID=A0A9P4I9D8_9PEZI|nr:hypothetical protein NA57DRAFT_58364 [Rhizodiscina lignyota]